MSEEIFEIYDFVRDNGLEVNCYGYTDREKEIIVFVSTLWVRDFLELLSNQVPGSLDEGGYEATITSTGDLGVEIMELINQHCEDEECNKWFNRFKKYSSECC